MPILHDILIGVITVAVLVLLIGEFRQVRKLRRGEEARITPTILVAALLEVASAAGMIAMVLLYAEQVDPVRVSIQSGLMLIVLVLTLAFAGRRPVPGWVFAGIGGASLVCYVYSSF